MFKAEKGLIPIFTDDIFPKNENSFAENISSNTRSKSSYYNYYNPKTVKYGLETLRPLGPKLWNIIPRDSKDNPHLTFFKEKIKKWIPLDCPCRLCKSYVPQLVYQNKMFSLCKSLLPMFALFVLFVCFYLGIVKLIVVNYFYSVLIATFSWVGQTLSPSNKRGDPFKVYGDPF